MSRFKAALSLYVALAVHLLLILLLAVRIGGGQSLRGSGSGLGGEDVVASAVNSQSPDPVAEQRRAAAVGKRDAHPDNFRLAATPIDLQPPKPKPEAPQAAKSATAATPAGSGRAGGGSGGYIAEVRAQLSRHRRSLPGVLTTARSEVAFSIAANGAVSEVQLLRSSGIAELDREATAMVLRASPFPAPPDGKPRRLRVPVSVEPPKL